MGLRRARVRVRGVRRSSNNFTISELIRRAAADRVGPLAIVDFSIDAFSPFGDVSTPLEVVFSEYGRDTAE